MCVCVCVCVSDLVLQFTDVIVDVHDLSVQHVGSTPALVQRAVVVLYGPLGESWENLLTTFCNVYF